MRILSAAATNFASYKEVAFSFTDQGLVLVSGPTGSGKSTLMDLVPWVLFGRTAKNGSVDEIISWTGKGQTTGMVELEVNGNLFKIIRTRKPNDLEIQRQGFEGTTRGKDLNDTQKRINELLGLDADRYLSSAYYHEFSQTAQFFTTTAKNRRQLTEQFADLSLAKELTESISDAKKQTKKEKEEAQLAVKLAEQTVTATSNAYELTIKKHMKWLSDRKAKLASLKLKAESFDQDRAKEIAELKGQHSARLLELEHELHSYSGSLIAYDITQATLKATIEEEKACSDLTCSECGAPKDNAKRLLLSKQRYNLERDISSMNTMRIAMTRAANSIEKHKAQLQPALDKIMSAKNLYNEQIAELKAQKSPHDTKAAELAVETSITDLHIASMNSKNAAEHLSDLELLLEVIGELRALTVKNTVLELEKNTNKMLTDHFDAEIRVKFDIEEADKLEVNILKDGNEASYTQLSKGQRGLLNLCFAVSVMRQVANHAGIKLNCAFIDEGLTGFDEQLKLKAFGLLQGLTADYESVFVVEHSPSLKEMFTKRYDVKLVDGNSQIEEA